MEKITNVQHGTLHEVIIYEGCVCLEVQMSHDDSYNLSKNVELDNPAIKKVG